MSYQFVPRSPAEPIERRSRAARETVYEITAIYREDDAAIISHGVCLRDRSAHGLGLFTLTRLEPNEEVSADVRDESGSTARWRCIVRHCRPHAEGFVIGLERVIEEQSDIHFVNELAPPGGQFPSML